MGRVYDRGLQNPGDDTYLDAELHFTQTHNIQNQGAFNELAEVWFKIEKKAFLSIDNSELLELVTMGGCRGRVQSSKRIYTNSVDNGSMTKD